MPTVWLRPIPGPIFHGRDLGCEIIHVAVSRGVITFHICVSGRPGGPLFYIAVVTSAYRTVGPSDVAAP